jgi:hypothetical protein
MTSLSLLSALVLYPLSLFGDGCVLIAVALAATVGGRPLLWGASFAAFHALYGVIGLLLAGEVATYSERLGELFVLVGSMVLLRHFMHHSLHHHVGDDCSCDNHKPIPVSTRAIVSTASAFSLHSLASGAVLKGIAGDVSSVTLLILIVAFSAVVGILIGVIVLVGNIERTPILRALDSLPGAVATLLTLLCCFSLYHLVHDVLSVSPFLQGLYVILSLALGIALGYRVHRHRALHRSPALSQISPSRSHSSRDQSK